MPLRQFCITSVWSTPRNPGNHARALRRVVINTAHGVTRRAPGTMEYIFTLKYQLGAMSRTWTPSSSVWAKPAATTRWRASACRAAWRWNYARARQPAKSAVRWTMCAALPDARLIEAARTWSA